MFRWIVFGFFVWLLLGLATTFWYATVVVGAILLLSSLFCWASGEF
mgnify:CR=1 FL=1